MRGFARRRPDVAVTMLAVRQHHRPRRRHPDDDLLLAAGRPDRAGVRRRGMQFIHEDDGLDALRLAHARGPPGHLQRRRRRRPHALPGGRSAGRPVDPCRCRAAGRSVGASSGARAGRLLPRADPVPHLRPGRRHHAGCAPVRLRPAVLDRARRSTTSSRPRAQPPTCRPSGWRRIEHQRPSLLHRKAICRGPVTRRDAAPPVKRRVTPRSTSEAGRRRKRARPRSSGAPRKRPVSARRRLTIPWPRTPTARVAERRAASTPDWDTRVARPGLPAPPDHRRLRGRRLRLRPRAHRPRAPGSVAPAVRASGSASRSAGSRTSRTRAARWSWPTTPAPSRSTR